MNRHQFVEGSGQAVQAPGALQQAGIAESQTWVGGGFAKKEKKQTNAN